ncbi:hypothetical protein ABZ935_06175 [Streptomyces coeruleorubidus]|uniref:hypothetical protein n=1 Tax=Streptomyces coeruleorubidus TaxID=116188 RepID=UPI0033CEC543
MPSSTLQIAAQHQRETAVVEDAAYGVGQCGGVRGDAAGVQNTGLRVPLRVVRGWLDAAGAHRAQPFGEPGAEECVRQFLDAGRAQPQYGRCLDDRHVSHVRLLRQPLHRRPRDGVQQAGRLHDWAGVRNSARRGAAAPTRAAPTGTTARS